MIDVAAGEELDCFASLAMTGSDGSMIVGVRIN
jgi:hypothetical protein